MTRQVKRDEPFYNVKILRNFVTYLRVHLNWTNTQLEDLFTACDSNLSFLESDDNWFNQDFADRFYYNLVQFTGDDDIAYKVGRFMPTHSSRGIGGSLVKGLLTPSTAFRTIGKVGSLYSRGATLIPVQVTNTKAIIRALISDGCDEQPYQCRNRIGMAQAVPQFFDVRSSKGFERQCFHRGGEYCEYEIHWNLPWYNRHLLFVGGTLALGFALTFIIGFTTINLFSFALLPALIFFIVLREAKSYYLGQTLKDQNEGLEESVQTLDRRHREATLLSEIMNATTEMMPINELCSNTAKLIREKMKYDRAILLLVNEKEGLLETKAAEGYFGEGKTILENTKFKIRSDNLTGYFIRALNTKQSFLERNIQKNMKGLSARSQALVKLLGTESLAVAPIMIHDKVLGVISVENLKKSRPLSNNDLGLIQNLADHIAVAISNSKNFEQERELRQLFQRYVPTEMRVELNATLALSQVESRNLSVMFIDIIDFTSLGEKLSPEKVVEILNIFIDEIQNIATRHKGIINKIMGDGLLIYFNPLESNSVDAGITILEALGQVNTRLLAQQLPEISIGIGIHRGPCILGNIGSTKRLDYTVIGDAVNTAFRIETITRKFGKNILFISDSLIDEVGAHTSIARGEIPLKGKTHPIQIFQVQPVQKSQTIKQAA